MRILCLTVLLLAACAGGAFLLSIAPVHRSSPETGYDRPEEAAHFFLAQRAWPSGIPRGAYARAAERVRHMEHAGLRKAERGWRWLNLGPVNIAGRIRAMAVDPQDAAIIYAGSAGGGVWKTTSSGRSWRQLDDLLPNLRIGAIDVDPFDRNHILAGCGEGYVAWQGYAAFGHGIYRSTDAGESWELLPSTDRQEFWYVYDVDFDPYAEGVILASTQQGVFRSSDGGMNWLRVLSDTQPPFSAMVDHSATQAGVVYAAREGSGILRSTDHGTTWRNLGHVAPPPYTRIFIATAPSNGDILYAAFTDRDARQCAGLYRSDDGGENWRALEIPRSMVSGETYMGGQGRFNSVLAVHPANPDIVWAGGIDLHRSTDGGVTWRQMTNWYPFKTLAYVHADQHALIFNPADPNEMLAGSDGGMFRSLNGGEDFEEMSGGMVTVQFHSGTPHPRSDMVIGGTIDNGTLRTTDGDRWADVIGGDGGYTAIDPDEPRLVYGELYYLHFLKSTNFGRNFYLAMNGIPRASDFGTSDPVAFIAPFEMAPWNPKVLFAGSNRVYRTTNGAESWTRISDNLSGDNSSFLTAIGLSAADPQVIWTGSSRGWIHVSTDGGMSWRRADSGLPAFYVTDVAVHAGDAGDVVVTYSGFGQSHVFRSTDLGATWQDLSGTGDGALPDIPVNTVFRHPERDAELYVGTDVGLFVSSDSGATWEVDNEGIGNVIIADIKMRPDGVLFVATHGRGMYRSSRSILSDAPVLPVTAVLAQNYPNPFTASTGYETVIPYTLVEEGNVTLRLFDMAGRLLRERNFGLQTAGDYHYPLDGRGLAGGAYVVRLFVNGRLAGERKMVRG
ncbi:MAG: hypothetical protein JXA28_10015 [Bacteroidetes bacterium]|nr:hypothetical protein [Bacteroidota bacterium]